MKNTLKKNLGIFVFFMLFGGFSPFSYGSDREVNFVALSDMTGPASIIAKPGIQGVKDYLRYVNERGGVDGVQIKLIEVDTRFDMARMVSGYAKYRKTKRLMAVLVASTAGAKLLRPKAIKDRLILHVPPAGKFQAKPAYLFLWGPPYADTFSEAMNWALEDWKQKGHEDSPTFGHISWGNDGGRGHLRGAREYAMKMGFKLLKPVYFPVGDLIDAGHLLGLRKADYIYMGGITEPAPTNIILNGHKMGIRYPKTTFISDYYAPFWNVDLKIHTKELQGWVATAFYLRGTEVVNHPFIKLLWTRYHNEPISEMMPFYLLGVSLGMTFEAGVKVAFKTRGYDAIDSDALNQAYQKLTGKDIFQGICGKCAFSPTSRCASNEVKFYQVKGSDLVPITGWRETPDAVSLYKWDK
ncbi:MAG: ABC transporter substrate-binding protein [Thermodesulfobacteriota bacterium]|nr:ABC transporter substrate-binding protein [Thermodesulfobacteriota bacterium]